MVVSTDLENKCLTLLIWHRIEIRDEVRVLTCSLKVRLESNIIPRSLTEDTGINCCPRKGTLISSTLLKSCFVPKRISLVLSGLISNLFVQHQEAISRRSSNQSIKLYLNVERPPSQGEISLTNMGTF